MLESYAIKVSCFYCIDNMALDVVATGELAMSCKGQPL